MAHPPFPFLRGAGAEGICAHVRNEELARHVFLGKASKCGRGRGGAFFSKIQYLGKITFFFWGMHANNAH